jgi:uncharacterized SAM-binding protein YcdF (DUF218 family)
VFFYVSKIAWFLAGPTNLLVIMGALGAALLFTRWRRLGRALATIGALGLFVIGFSPLAKFIARPLEDRFPQREAGAAGPVDGIVVLGGGIGFGRGQIAFNEAAARLTAGVELAKKHPGARLVFTGGDGSLVLDGRTEADAAQEFFRLAGIDGTRVMLESRSRNTRENAAFTRELVRPQAGERWLVVTSAFHMPRAIGCFRAVGFSADAYPVDYRTEGDASDLLPFRFMFNGMQLTDLAVKEWLGLAVYYMAGYTPEFLPGPQPDQASSARIASEAN